MGGDSYFYSLVDDDKPVSDSWSTFQGIFSTIILVAFIFLWVEHSEEEVENDTANQPVIILSNTSNESTTQTEPIVSTPQSSFPTRYASAKKCEPPQTPTNSNESELITIVIEDSSTSLLAAATTPINTSQERRSTLRRRNRPKADERISQKPKLRRSLRFCEPNISDTPVRRSLRLNPTKKQKEVSSSELLYCNEWCKRHSGNRSRSNSRPRRSPHNKNK